MADDESVGGVQGGDCEYGVYQHSGSQRKMSKAERTKVKVGMYGSHRDCRVVMLMKALKDCEMFTYHFREERTIQSISPSSKLLTREA